MKYTQKSFKLRISDTPVWLSLLIALSVFIPAAAQESSADAIRRLKAGNARYSCKLSLSSVAFREGGKKLKMVPRLLTLFEV